MNPPRKSTDDPAIDEVIALLVKLLMEGLRHGFFDYSVSCETVQGGKRRLLVRAGKSHSFTIRPDELPD